MTNNDTVNHMHCPECERNLQRWDEHEMLGELILEHEWTFAEAKAWIEANRPGGTA